MDQNQSYLMENGPGFDADVVGNGAYAWWYVDALSDDGVHGLTMIAFIGSVFSPYYAWSNWADPFAHCAINVALYRLDGGRGRWAMTERGKSALTRDASHFTVGPSALRWENGVLTAHIEEITMPIPSRLRGTIKLTPQVCPDIDVALDPHARHHWRPLAPRARVDLDFASPDLAWSGDGYFDTNHGVEPLERAFVNWHWGRAHHGDGVKLFYDMAFRGGGHRQVALDIDANGNVAEAKSPPTRRLPGTFWRVGRFGWCDAGGPCFALKTLEDTPFYARSALRTSLDGQPSTMMHESLDLNRLSNPVVRAMLPFRMPRVGG